MAIVNVELKDTFDDWRIKTNEIASLAGDLDDLITIDKATPIAAINELKLRADQQGLLSALTTDVKTTIVGAINEVDANGNQHAIDIATNLASINTLNAQVAARVPNVQDKIYAYGNAGSGIVFDSINYDCYTFTRNFSPLVLTATTLPIGRTFYIVMTNGIAGTITWPTGTKWPGGVQPTWAATGIDKVQLQRISSTGILANVMGINFL